MAVRRLRALRHLVGSAASFGSAFSAGSLLSIGSAGSILSIGSGGSILSIFSAGSILGIGRAGDPARAATAVGTVLAMLGLIAVLTERDAIALEQHA